MTETPLPGAWIRAQAASAARAPLASVNARAMARWGRQRWLLGSLLLASGAAGAPAMAQGARSSVAEGRCAPVQAPPRGSAAVGADREVVKFYEKAGVKALHAEQWEKARMALLEAFKREPHWQIAANLGWAELRAGQPRDAAEHLSLFLRDAQNVSEADRQQAEQMLAEAKAALGTVTVQVDVVGADVLVDGLKIGMSPLPEAVCVEPGSRTFEAKKAGLPPGRQVIEVAAGSAPVVEIRTAEKAEPPVPPRPTQERHTVLPGSGSQRSKALISAGIGVSAGIAAVGIGTMIGAAQIGKASRDDWAYGNCTKTMKACTDKFDLQANRKFYLDNTAFWTFLGAGVIGGATAIYALTGSGSASKSMPSAALLVSPRGGGIVVTGSF
jgi:hypothetical protein